MNRSKIKDQLISLTDILSVLKTQVENYYTAYKSNFEAYFEQEISCYSEEQEKDARREMEEEYLYISIDQAAAIYSDLGLPINKDKIFQRISTEYDFYVVYPFQTIWEIAKNLPSDDFFIAILSILNNINEKDPLGKFFFGKVYQLIKNADLDHIYENFVKRKSVFVAMWFDESMALPRSMIEKAIRECGYNPILIDKKEHSNQIVPEIFHEIKKSVFVVADLTGQRKGVYYEAGYAEALGKTVILTCSKKDFEECHFDIAQKNIIFWDSLNNLESSLKNRITAICPIMSV